MKKSRMASRLLGQTWSWGKFPAGINLTIHFFLLNRRFKEDKLSPLFFQLTIKEFCRSIFKISLASFLIIKIFIIPKNLLNQVPFFLFRRPTDRFVIGGSRNTALCGREFDSIWLSIKIFRVLKVSCGKSSLISKLVCKEERIVWWYSFQFTRFSRPAVPYP